MSLADPGVVARWQPRRGLAKYLKIFRASLTERLHYRGDFFLGTVLCYLPMVTTILLWQAVYAGTGKPNSSIAGYTAKEMIAYLLLIHVSRAFSSMPGLAGGISRDIREAATSRNICCSRWI